MQIKKRLSIILLCVLLLSGCVRERPATIYEMPEKSEKPYNTVEVRLDTFRQTKEVQSPARYLKSQGVFCDYEDATMKEKADLAIGDRVKAGDVLATISFDTSEAELARLELAYERAVYAMDNGISSYYQSIASIKGNDRVSHLQRLQIEYQLASYKLSAEDMCQQALEQLEAYKVRYQDVEIVAPCDGVVDYINPIYPGEKIPYGAELFTLADPESMYLELRLGLPTDEDKVVYPMISTESQVVVTRGDFNERCQISSAPIMGMLSKNEVTSGENNCIAYITDDGLADMAGSGAFYIRYTVLELENMIIVPKKAVQDYEPKKTKASDQKVPLNGEEENEISVQKDPYVNLLIDGNIIKRYVTCGPTNGTDICILDGLTPGQLVVVDDRLGIKIPGEPE